MSATPGCKNVFTRAGIAPRLARRVLWNILRGDVCTHQHGVRILGGWWPPFLAAPPGFKVGVDTRSISRRCQVTTSMTPPLHPESPKSRLEWRHPGPSSHGMHPMEVQSASASLLSVRDRVYVCLFFVYSCFILTPSQSHPLDPNWQLPDREVISFGARLYSSDWTDGSSSLGRVNKETLGGGNIWWHPLSRRINHVARFAGQFQWFITGKTKRLDFSDNNRDMTLWDMRVNHSCTQLKCSY